MKLFRKTACIAFALAMLAAVCTPAAAEWAGQAFRFVTTDLDGNEVTSEEIFGKNKITLVNLWAAQNDSCGETLSELAKIHTSLQASGCGIVGILNDAAEEGAIEKAKALMLENEIHYPVLAPSEEILTVLRGLDTLPVSFFVAQNGVIVGSVIEGNAVEEYEPAVLALLNGEASPATCYRVIVTDKNGSPVQGVAIQFCSEESCTMLKTNADGTAIFNMPEGTSYTVHILKVPKGYAPDAAEYPVPAAYGDIRLTVDFAS